MIGNFSFHNTFIPELSQHFQHVLSDLLWVKIEVAQIRRKPFGVCILSYNLSVWYC